MIHQLKNRNFYVILAGDLALFAASLILAYGLRFSLDIPEKDWIRIFFLLPFLLPTKMGSSGKFLSENPQKNRTFQFARPAAPREWAHQSSSERGCGRGQVAAVFGIGFRRALLEPL